MDPRDQRQRWPNEEVPAYVPYQGGNAGGYVYDNGGYAYPEGPFPTTRFPGVVKTYPYYVNTKRGEDPDSETSSTVRKNKRLCMLIAVIVVAVLVVGGIVGAIIGVLFAQQEDGASRNEPLTRTRVEIQKYPGEATLKDLVFTDDYKNPESPVYKQTEQDFITKMDNKMMQSNMSDGYNGTVVDGFTEGSVVIQYTIVLQVVIIFTVNQDGSEVTTTTEAGVTPAPVFNPADVANIVGSLDNVEPGSAIVAATSPCDSSPCQNGATCTGVDTYTCECPSGFTGTSCELDVNECESSPCENGGTCNNLDNMFECICAAGFEGIRCETNINECALGPCQNGGSCTDKVNSYTCACASGFTGTNCQSDVDECDSNPCINDGTCSNLVNSYSCACSPGFEDVNCQTDIDECLSDPCDNGGECNDVINGYSCTCATGFQGPQCQTNIDECDSNPCLNGGSCEDGVDSYYCDCAPGWSGINCVININECALGPCQNGGSCTDKVNSYTCTCASGFTGTNCQSEINECESNPCLNGGICADNVDSYTCSCAPGYAGVNCQTNINECASNPCQNGGSCRDEVNGFSCTSCSPGYTGTLCQNDINECSSIPCQNGGSCSNNVNSFTCNCISGYVGPTCETEINECENNPCHNGGSCDDLLNAFKCYCVPGYTGQLCQTSIDECSSNPCQNGACSDLLNGYSCACYPGYSGSNCEINVDECASSPCINGECHDDVNKYMCDCYPGFTGLTCQIDIDECASGPCVHSTFCLDMVNDYACTCKDGYEGRDCEIDIDDCASNPCDSTGTLTCIDLVDNYECTCLEGYSGRNCEIDIDDCATNPCVHSTTCIDFVNDYVCTCSEGYQGKNCEIDIDDCATNPCVHSTTCIDFVNDYVCTCSEGYQGKNCEIDIDDCINFPCDAVGSMDCFDLVNDYECQCLDGYEGKNCEIDKDDCASDPCLYGASCIDLQNDYLCLCSEGYDGKNCQIALTTTTMMPSTISGPTGVTPELTTTPSLTPNCTGGNVTVEIWASLHYHNYSANLQNRSSAEFANQTSHVMSMVSFLFSLIYGGPIYPVSTRDVQIVHFQRLNGTFNSTVTLRVCMYSFIANEGFLYTYVDTVDMGLLNFTFLGLKVGRHEAPWTVNFTCPEVYYSCLDDALCIPDAVFCDGVDNCNYGEDELVCNFTTSVPTTPITTVPTTTSPGGCRQDQFTCQSTYKCIPLSWVCDNYFDCGIPTDVSDETGCVRDPCRDDQFQCFTTKMCRPLSYTCDHYNDCGDNSDEEDALCKSTTTQPTTPVPCGMNEYTCFSIHHCVDKLLLCDGSYDCEDWSDEWGCPTTPFPIPTALDVMLIQGDEDTTTELYGTVMVRRAGGADDEWGTVCDDMWGVEEARVVCRQLGYSGEDVYGYPGAWFGRGSGPVYLGNMRCNGEELDLMQCHSTLTWGNIHCGHNQDASVSCGQLFTTTTLQPPTPTSGQTTETTESPKPSLGLRDGNHCLEGLLEVTRDGQKGTVCDDGFGYLEATIACKALGFSGMKDYGSNLFDFSGPSNYPILLDDVKCQGDEATLFECSHNVYDNCGHYEDVGVICEGDPLIDCYDGPVTESVDCNFTRHNCQYIVESEEGEATWSLGRITSFESEDAYMYMSNTQGSSKLTSPPFDGKEDTQTLEFMYSIKNSEYSNLLVTLGETDIDRSKREVLDNEVVLLTSEYLPYDVDSQWIYFCKELPTAEGKTYKLAFKGTTSLDTMIAVDSINVTSNICRESIYDGPCTFDRLSECGVEYGCGSTVCQRDSHPYQWYWHNHGPYTTEKVFRANAAFGAEGDKATARFQLPMLREGWYLSFRGHMEGLNIGQLIVSLDINGREFDTLAKIQGSQGRDWFEWCSKLPDIALDDSYDLELRFDAIRGASPYYDIFLDDIRLLDSCMENRTIADSYWAVENTFPGYGFKYAEDALEGKTRMVNGSRSYRGFLQVYHHGIWGSICDNYGAFRENEVDVACRAMGFSSGSYSFTDENSDSPGFWLKDINCDGTENSILECERSEWGNAPGCYRNDHLYLVCSYFEEQAPLPYFPKNTFVIEDSNTRWTGKGFSASLRSKELTNNNPGNVMNVKFRLHKATYDKLEIWIQEGGPTTQIDQEVTPIQHTYDPIVDTYENELMCFEFTPTMGSYTVGLDVTKTSRERSVVDLTELNIEDGPCKARIGTVRCDFETESTGCEYKILPVLEDDNCVTDYGWTRVKGINQSDVMQGNPGYFMYMNSGWGSVAVSTLELVMDATDYVPYACTIRFNYFITKDWLTFNLDGVDKYLYPGLVKPYLWRQACYQIKPMESCPLGPGELTFSFTYDSDEAGIDDVYISSENCPAEDITCDYEDGETCGYRWGTSGGDLFINNGTLTNLDGVEEFTVISPLIQNDADYNCLVVYNKEYLDYTLTLSIRDDNGVLRNSTSTSSYDSEQHMSLEFVGLPNGCFAVLEGRHNGWGNASVGGVSIDYIELHLTACALVDIPCKMSEFTCDDGSCVPNYRLCDGQRDCPSGEDEKTCNCTMSREMFNCTLTGCIKTSLRCDGIDDCLDGSDESCDPSMSCTFNDSFLCGYTGRNATFTGPGIELTDDVAYLESPVADIQTESCYTINWWSWKLDPFTFRVIGNESNTLIELGWFEVYPEIDEFGFVIPKMQTTHVHLPAYGQYSVLLENQGAHMGVVNVSFTSDYCPEDPVAPSTTIPSTSGSTSTVGSPTSQTATPSTSPQTTIRSTSQTTIRSTPQTTTFSTPQTTNPTSSQTTIRGSTSQTTIRSTPQTTNPTSSQTTIRSTTQPTTIPTTFRTAVTGTMFTTRNTTIPQDVTSVTTTMPSTTIPPMPDDFPVVAAVPVVSAAYGQRVDLTCTVGRFDVYETVLHWYFGSLMISRNNDIMVKDEDQSKYSAGSSVDIDNNLVYKLTVRVDPPDGILTFYCLVDVIGYPYYDALSATVQASVPVTDLYDPNCIPNPFQACSDSGFDYYRLPNIKGKDNHAEVEIALLDKLYHYYMSPSFDYGYFYQPYTASNYSLEPVDSCGQVQRELTCGLYTPRCLEDGSSEPVCREHCEDIQSTCYAGKESENVAYFCKFLPYVDQGNCKAIYFACGSQIKINTSIEVFRLRSEGYPSSAPESPCSYMISRAPAWDNEFYMIQITIEELTLDDNQCDQSSLTVGDEQLCNDVTLPYKVTVPASSVTLTLNPGDTGSFKASMKYVMPLCNITQLGFYSYRHFLLDVTEPVSCSGWVFVLDPYFLYEPEIVVTVTSIASGCITLNHNTETPSTSVCMPKTVRLPAATSLTVTADSETIFSLNVSYTEDGATEQLYIIGASLSEGTHPGSGFTVIQRSDGYIGVPCYINDRKDRDAFCSFMGYSGPSDYKYHYDDHLPNNLRRLVSSLKCEDRTNITSCTGEWEDEVTCYGTMILQCSMPSVSCDLSNGTCGYSVGESNRESYTLSPVFIYTKDESVTIKSERRGTPGDKLSVSIITEDDNAARVLYSDPETVDALEGSFKICISLPDDLAGTNVRLNFTFTHPTAPFDDLLSSIEINLHDNGCEEGFPDGRCDFDDLSTCLPFIEATSCMGDAWKITEGKLIGDTKYLKPSVASSLSLPLYLPPVSTPTTKFLSFLYHTDATEFFMNQMNFSVGYQNGEGVEPIYTLIKHNNNNSDATNSSYGNSDAAKQMCLAIPITPDVLNTMIFKVVSNISLGFVSIDTITLTDTMCPHPSSCDFERDCEITTGNDTDVMWFRKTSAFTLQIEDHTFDTRNQGSYMTLYDMGAQGGASAWVTIATIPLDSTFQCFTFYYQVELSTNKQSSTPFMTVTAAYESESDFIVKSFDIAEYRGMLYWNEAHVPIESEGVWETVTISIKIAKVFDDSNVMVLLDDISLEPKTCKYGLENLGVCTFSNQFQCKFSTNGTAGADTPGSGYIWDVNVVDELLPLSERDHYLHVSNAEGPENSQSYVSFDVNDADSTGSQYQIHYKSTQNSGTLETMLEMEGSDFEEEENRKKRSVTDSINIPLVGHNRMYLSDCYPLPDNFVGKVHFLATRGAANEGGIAIGAVFLSSLCSDPTIICDFTGSSATSCGYTPDYIGGLSYTDAGYISVKEGTGLVVPLNKLEYQTACMTFRGQITQEDSNVTIHVAMETSSEIFHLGPRSDNSFIGQVNVSKTGTKGVTIVLPENGAVISGVDLTEGNCGPPVCDMDEFQCEETCIPQAKQCDSNQDCHSGLDEDNCGFELDCLFDDNTCFYSDVGRSPSSWGIVESHTFDDGQGNQLTLVPDVGMVMTTFPDLTTAHARLTSKPIMIHTDSCLMYAYAGTVGQFDASVTYDSGEVLEWNDTAVNSSKNEWKPALLNVHPGHVVVSFETSMIGMKNGLPFLQRNAFLAIDDVVLSDQPCAEVLTVPECPSGLSHCADRSMCLPDDNFCDNMMHCPDHSDEDDCEQVYKLDCTFEDPDDETCNYVPIDQGNTNHEWTRVDLRYVTQPTHDHTYRNKSGHALIHMITSSFYGDPHNATVASAPVTFNQNMCVKFWYYMNATRFQPNGVTAQLFAYVEYMDDPANGEQELHWFDHASRYMPNWNQGAIPVLANRRARIRFTAKTSIPISISPGVVGIDDITSVEGDCDITQECRDGSFECTHTGVCIPGYFRCDGTTQCTDETDEHMCEKPENIVSIIGGEGSYGRVRAFLGSTWHPVCASYDDIDIQARSICRNQGFSGRAEGFIYPLADSNQEPVFLNCSTEGECNAIVSTCYSYLGVKCSADVCFSGYQLCPGTKSHCIPESRFCDGLQDCEGNSDEQGCAECNAGEFQCANHECIPISYRCDGWASCADGSDEFRCVQLENGEVSVWDPESQAMSSVCHNGIDKQIAAELCHLSGKGYVSQIQYRPEYIQNGAEVTDTWDPATPPLINLAGALFKISNTECFPLHLECSLPECGSTVAKENSVELNIMFGDEVVPGEYPWHCVLFNRDGRFLCGASYIGHGAFLTAAHCLSDFFDAPFSVRCGTVNVKHLGDYGTEYPITRFTLHPSYSYFGVAETFDDFHDIAVMETSTPPDIDNFTRPVCVGSSEDFDVILNLGNAAECYSTGMGRTESYVIDTTADDEQELLEVKLNFLDIDLCNRTILERGSRLNNDGLCTITSSIYPPSCSGDSGSPIVCKHPHNGRWYQFAVVSYGFGCYEDGSPAVQNKVFSHLDWINEATGWNVAQPFVDASSPP